MKPSQAKDYNSMQYFYDQFKEAFELRGTARFWFGSLLSIVDKMDMDHLNIDLQKQESERLMQMVNHALADIAFFYLKEPPEEVFKFLEVAKRLLHLGPTAADTRAPGYRMIMHQVHFHSSLALFGLKSKQYSFALECFDWIMQVFNQETVDTCSDVFLSALSNYLSFLRAYQYSNFTQRIKEVLQQLQNLYQNLINKYMRSPCDKSSILLMLGVYKQHEVFLSRDFRAQNLHLLNKYGISSQESAKSVAKNLVSKAGDIKVKKKELSFFSAPINQPKEQPHKRFSIRDAREKQRNLFEGMEGLTQTNSEMLLVIPEKKKIEPHYPSQANSPKLSARPKETLIQTISAQKTIREQTIVKAHPKLCRNNVAVTLKVNYVVLQIIKEGAILSDFLREKRKFLSWTEVYKLIKKLKYSSVLISSLPAQTFYDVGKMLAPYLRKNDKGDPNKGFIVDERPKEFIQISIFMKLFKQDGPYLKIFLMNHYDVSRVEFGINCYLHDFTSFFELQSKDEYIQSLNNTIFDRPTNSQSNDGFTLATYKKTRATVKQELEAQLRIEDLRDREDFKNCLFNIMLMMQNSKRILVCFDTKFNKPQQVKQRGSLVFYTSEVGDGQQMSNKLIIPIYKLQRYFPPSFYDDSKWLNRFGHFMIEAHIHSFTNYPSSFVNQQYLNVISYAKKVEMERAGKYVVPVSAEIVGSTQRIWGIVIKFFQQAMVQEEVTFIFNPYFELFAPLLKETAGTRRKVLQEQLLGGSVKKTYARLKEKKAAGKVISLMEYWGMAEL